MEAELETAREEKLRARGGRVILPPLLAEPELRPALLGVDVIVDLSKTIDLRNVSSTVSTRPSSFDKVVLLLGIVLVHVVRTNTLGHAG